MDRINNVLEERLMLAQIDQLAEEQINSLFEASQQSDDNWTPLKQAILEQLPLTEYQETGEIKSCIICMEDY